MVSLTKRSDVVLVTFRCSFTDQSSTTAARVADDREVEVVSYVRINAAGIRIFYSHHIIRYKEAKTGHYSGNTIMRMPIENGLQAVIMQGVMFELWESMPKDIAVFPGPPESMMESVDGI